MLTLKRNINDIVPKITYYLNIREFKEFLRCLLFVYHKNNINIDIKYIIENYINNYIKYPLIIDIYKKIKVINKHSYLNYYFDVYQLCNNYETNYENNYKSKYCYIDNSLNYKFHMYKLLEIWYVKNLLISIIDEKYKSKFNNICHYINKKKLNIDEVEEVKHHIFKNNDFIRFFKYSYE